MNNLIASKKLIVFNLLNSSFFQFKKGIIPKKEYDTDLIELFKKKKVPFEIDKTNQNKETLLFIKSYRYVSLKNLLEDKNQKKNLIILILDGITDPQNFGSIIRTCAALNIDGIIIGEKNQVPVNSTVIKVSSGGIAYTPICKVGNLSKTLELLKKENIQIICTSCDKKESTPVDKTNFNKRCCIILGNEEKGVKKTLIKKSDKIVNILMSNNMNSLNVGVSCGLICFWIIASTNQYRHYS